MDDPTDANIAASIAELRISLDREHSVAHEQLFQHTIILPKRRKQRKAPQQSTWDTTPSGTTISKKKCHRRTRGVVVPLPTTEDAQMRFVEVCNSGRGKDMAALLERVEKENIMLLQSLSILERESTLQNSIAEEQERGQQQSNTITASVNESLPPDAQSVSAAFSALVAMRAVSDTLLPGVGLSIDEETGLLVSSTVDGGVFPVVEDSEAITLTNGGRFKEEAMPSISTSNKCIQTVPESQVPLDGATCPYTPAMDATYIVRSIPHLGSDGGSGTSSMTTRSCIVHRSHTLDERGRTSTITAPSTNRPQLDHGSLATPPSSTPTDSELSDFQHKVARNVMAAGANMTLRPSTATAPLYEALPSTPRSHLHPPLSTTIDPSLQSALHKSNAFRSYLANSVGSVVPMSAIAAFEPTSLRDLATAILSQPNMGYDPLRMMASVSHMYEGSLTLGMLLVTDTSVVLLREGSEIPTNRKTLILPKASFRKLQVGATLTGDKAAPPLSNAMPPPALHFYLSPSIPPSALQQQFYRTVTIQCTLPHKNKAGYYSDSVQTIVFETDSDIMKFLSLMDLDVNGARASPFSPFYCPTVQLQKHFGDYGWRKRWGGVGFGEQSWLSEGSNTMAGLASVGGAAATAIATSGSKAALAAGLTLDAATSRQVTSLTSRSMVPLPIRQHCYSKTATLSTQHNFPITSPLLPVEAQLCSAHHIHPRAFSELKATLLFDPAFGSWFTALDVAAYVPPLNGKHFNVRQARIVLEFWMYFTKQVESVEVVQVMPP